MNPPPICLAQVERVMQSSMEAGKSPTVAQVHAELGGQCPVSTVIKLMAEAIASAAAYLPTPDAQAGLRLCPGGQGDSSRKQLGVSTRQMQSAIDLLALEAKQGLGEATAAAERIARLETERCSLVAELKRCRVQLEMMRENLHASRKTSPIADPWSDEARTTLGL